MWHETLLTLLDGYSPVASFKESTHQFNTQELHRKLIEHCGEDVPTNEMVELLKKWGFKYARTGNLELEWLFRAN